MLDEIIKRLSPSERAILQRIRSGAATMNDLVDAVEQSVRSKRASRGSVLVHINSLRKTLAGTPWRIDTHFGGGATTYNFERESLGGESVWDRLLESALALNDKLEFHAGHVEYAGSMNLAEDFRSAVNEAWHVRSGMADG